VNNTRLFKTLAGGFGLTLLIACSSQSGRTAHALARPEVYWPDRATVFLADSQAGVVRALNIRSGIVPLGEIVTPTHAAVLSLSLDVPAKCLWVLDHGALHAYDAVTLRLLRRWPAPDGVGLTILERDVEGAVLVVAADGHRYRPDPNTLHLSS
jgi:hypothetical protein